MSEYFAIDTAGQVPKITRPDFRHGSMIRQLASDRFSETPYFDKGFDKERVTCIWHLGTERRFEIHRLIHHAFCGQTLTARALITKKSSWDILKHIKECGTCIHGSRGSRLACDDARQADDHAPL
jgi:hypothetical protein